MSLNTTELHQETQERVGYELSADVWRGPLVTIADRSGQELLVFSVDFLSQGRVNNFAYILQCIHMAYVVSDGHIRNQEGIELDPQDVVTSGSFVYCNAESVSCTPRIGPRFKFKSRPPHAGDDSSTMSNSKRSSANQSSFRLAVAVRDGFCLVSDATFHACTAAHILPVSRPEYYAEVLGRAPTSLFQARFGLLLRDDIHHLFDRGHIALYPLMNAEDELVVHVFCPNPTELKSYHGKIIRSGCRFRSSPHEYPDTQLLMFHYQQCVIKCLRGWSAF